MNTRKLTDIALALNCLLLAFIPQGYGQEPTAALDSPSQLLRSVEKAWDAHDLEALADCYSDEALLIILPNGTVVSGKRSALRGVKSVWENVKIHRFTDVARDVTGDLAWFWVTVRDQRQDGSKTAAQWFMLAVQREGHWRICFGMPSIILPRVFVEDVLPGAGQDAGVEKGDAIVEYDGELVTRYHSFARRVASTGRVPEVDLTVLRDGRSIRLRPKGGRLGVRLRESWVAAPTAVFKRDPVSHPAVHLVRRSFTDLIEGDIGRVKATWCPRGFFMPSPGDSGFRGRTRLRGASDFGALEEDLRQQMDELSKGMAMNSMRLADLRMVTAGKIAVVGAKMRAKRRDTGREVAMPVAIAVLVEQDGEWSLAASLPLGMEIIPASVGN